MIIGCEVRAQIGAMQYGTRGAAAPERDDDPAVRRVWALPVPMSRQKAPSLIATALLAAPRPPA